MVHFVRAGFHFVVHHNFPPLCDLVQSAAAGSSVSELATCLEQLCKQRETREKCEGEKEAREAAKGLLFSLTRVVHN